MKNLIKYLKGKGIIDNVEPKEDFEHYSVYRRIINFLQDFSKSHEDLIEKYRSLRESTVLVVGLGAVGTWVSANLVQSGIKRIVLMDPDKVEISNLHRQFGYNINSVGKYKIDILGKRLLEYNKNLKVIKIYDYLSNESLENVNLKLDLVINCADNPNVDETSLIVGEYCMKNKIPHIIGGGYNLHLSLIGQTVIPNDTACIKCFEKTLAETNKIDTKRVKKLNVKNRKIGSFGPMCTIISSFIGMESIKILSKITVPANLERRGEFDIYNMEIRYNSYPKRKDCDWCGEKGKYNN